MSRIRIVHRTGYDYSPGASGSLNEVRMTPLASHGQLVLANRIEISPPAWRHTYIDYWGTTVTVFEVDEVHTRLRVVATSEVDVQRPDTHPDDQLAWDDLTDPSVHDDFVEFLDATPTTDCTAILQELVATARGASTGPADAVRRAQALLAERIRYMRGVTHVHSHAKEAWDAGAGVCQDLSHLLLGACRMLGVPARYVSGYLMPALDPPLGEAQSAESHSWVSFWDGDWVGIDPITGGRIDERYVEVGIGRDYFDVAPLTGIYFGGETSDMYVQVELTRVS